METTPAPLGEVIAAATTYFTAQCIEIPRSESITALPDPPPFGSLVRIGGLTQPTPSPLSDFDDPFETLPTVPAISAPTGPLTVYGVVCEATTGSIEPGRPITAFGLDEDALMAAQPQIYELLATHFTALPIAHIGADGILRPYLPPRPARPHARVWPVTPAETRRVTERLDYLRGLLSGSAGSVSYPADELVAALLRHACVTAYANSSGGENATAFLLRAGRALASLLPTEYDRLRALIGQIAPGR